MPAPVTVTATEMEYAIFMNLVHSMRTKQRDYFLKREPHKLEQSKKLEREVDEAIRAYYNPQGTFSFDGDTTS